MNKISMIDSIHKIFRKDEYIVMILKTGEKVLLKIDAKLQQIKKEFLFSTMSADRIEQLEKVLDFKTTSTTLEGKRLEIEARWKSSGKCDLDLLQLIAEAWKADTVKLKFDDGIIAVDFLAGINSDYDITGLRTALNEAKPAHLPLLLTATEQYHTNEYFGCFLQEEVKIDLSNMKTNDDMIQNSEMYIGAYMEVAEIHEL